MTTPDMKPLGDIRVLSVTVFLAGPFLGMTLARFGAEVIKIEVPGGGDPIRGMGPFAGPEGVHSERQTDEDVSTRYLKRSEGVKSVTLNLKDPAGRQMFLDLAKQADVVIENLSPGSMKRLQLGYDDVAKVNPGIIYCSISGYGQTGPYKDLAAHDYQIQAMSGIMDMNGAADGPPTRVGFFVGDLVTPLFAAYSILGALRHREKTGNGQYLDASMMDTLASLMFMETIEDAVHEGKTLRAGNDGRGDPTGLYRLTDGDVFITVGTAARWKNLCNAIGAEEVFANPRYATASDRTMHVGELRHEIQSRLGKLDCAAATELLEAASIPTAPVRTLPEVMADDHFRDRGTLRPMYRAGVDAPVERGVMSGFPVTFSGGELPALEGGAQLGAHSEEVYDALLGLDAATLAELRKKGVV
ncbi:MAG: crotonobetainyl-CoA:carnitine CoA-transferase CaiB-like acyl-CoA transferase [Alphaproteobacteria bacterium]|jgi:crotonobetainyl-CoA:carnitine CoA-transferase CaiB-like acyl-CoA transferase